MSFDQTNINLVELIGRDTVLKKVAATAGGEWHGACPFCGGKLRKRVLDKPEIIKIRLK